MVLHYSNTLKEGSEVIKNDYEGDDSEIKNIIDAYNKGVREDKVTLNDVQVLAHSRFSVFVDYMKTTSVYQIIENHLKEMEILLQASQSILTIL